MSKSQPSAEAKKSKAIDGILVRTVPGVKRFRRAGYAFSAAPVGFALSALTEKQLQALEDEPNLITERVTFSADDNFISE